MAGLAERRGVLSGATIVFDLDGTVADTAPDLIDAANAALAAHGLPPASAEVIKPGVGYGTKAMLRAALASLGRAVDDRELQSMADALVRHYDGNIAGKTVLFPGFVDAASSLKEDGALLVLCTNKREALAKKLLDAMNLGEFFSGVAGGDTFSFCKPDPRHITELVRLSEGDPARAVMVGDSEADIAAAHAAGIASVAVSFGYAKIPAHELGASAVINHFKELPAVVMKLLARLD